MKQFVPISPPGACRVLGMGVGVAKPLPAHAVQTSSASLELLRAACTPPCLHMPPIQSPLPTHLFRLQALEYVTLEQLKAHALDSADS